MTMPNKHDITDITIMRYCYVTILSLFSRYVIYFNIKHDEIMDSMISMNLV